MHIAHRHDFVVAYLWHHRKNVIRKAKALWELMFSYNRKENQTMKYVTNSKRVHGRV